MINVIKTIGLFTASLLFLLLFSFWFLPKAIASDIIELQEVKINYKSFFPGGSDPLITQNGLGHGLDKELNLHLNTNVLQYFYWNNMVHSQTDSNPEGGGQFRLVGLSMQFGVRVTDYLDVGYHHFSKHLLDYQYPLGRFPVQDSVEINLYLFRKGKVDSVL